MTWVLLLLRVGLAAVLTAAAAAKLADLPATRAALRGFGVSARIVGPASWALPLGELALAALLIPATTARAAAIAVTGLLIAFTLALLRSPEADCNCFGALGGPRTGRRPLVRNGILAAAAVAVAVGGPGAGLGGLDATEALLAGALVVIAGLAWACWALVGQNRRLLAERRADGSGAAPHEPEAAASAGLPSVPPVGAAAPPFALTDAAGAFHTLDDLLVEGLPVVLVFSDPDCAACTPLPATLARIQAERADELVVALITRGPVFEGPFAPVLVQAHHEVARAYGAGQVPSALLIDPDGRVASRLAVGEMMIQELLATPTMEEVG